MSCEGEGRKMFTRLGRLRNDDSVAQIAGKAVADGKKSGERTGGKVGQEWGRLSAAGRGRRT